MAHVHGEKMVETAKKIVEEATCPMMESGMGGMMGSGMSGLMEHGAGMGMGTMMVPRAMTAGAATGAAVTAASATGRSLLGRMGTHPLVLFGAGVALGYLIHKYREEIIQKASQAAEQGKDFVS